MSMSIFSNISFIPVYITILVMCETWTIHSYASYLSNQIRSMWPYHLMMVYGKYTIGMITQPWHRPPYSLPSILLYWYDLLWWIHTSYPICKTGLYWIVMLHLALPLSSFAFAVYCFNCTIDLVHIIEGQIRDERVSNHLLPPGNLWSIGETIILNACWMVGD